MYLVHGGSVAVLEETLLPRWGLSKKFFLNYYYHNKYHIRYISNSFHLTCTCSLCICCCFFSSAKSCWCRSNKVLTHNRLQNAHN